MNIRYTKILDLISDNKKIKVADLSKLLNVSEVTVRKDLAKLEKEGLLRREHGFAAPVENDDIGNRLSFNYDVKHRIAQNALSIIKDGETVMIESGSCCAILAEEIAANRRDVTIITNSVFIASFIRQKPFSHVILLGGEFQNESQVMVGPLVRKCAENFHVDKFFIGTDGFNQRGAMAGNMMRAEAVRDMAESAENVIILTESKKFSQTGVVPLLPYEKISAIYTDGKASEIAPKYLESKLVMTAD